MKTKTLRIHQTFTLRLALMGLILGLIFPLLFFYLQGPAESAWKHDSRWPSLIWLLLGSVPLALAFFGLWAGRKLDLVRGAHDRLSGEGERIRDELAVREEDGRSARGQLDLLEKEIERLRRISREQHRQLSSMQEDLANRIRQNGLLKAQREEAHNRLGEIEAGLYQRTSQFERIKCEMEHQIKERAQTEEQLLESQTRLKLINSLSIELTSGKSDQEVILLTIKEIKNSFPDLLVYFGEIEDERILRVSQATQVSGLGKYLRVALDLNRAPEYLEQLKSGEPIVAEDISLDQRVRPLCDKVLDRGITGMLEMPVMYNDKLAGLLGLGSYNARAWTDHEVRTLSEIAQYLTLSLRSAEVDQERERAARELLRAKDAAEAAAKSKASFLATMSHEIRTPLNGVIGMTRLILETDLSEEQREYARIIHSSGEILMTLINDILDFSKIEVGKLELEYIPFEVRSIIEDSGELLALKAQEKGLELITYLNPDVPIMAYGDPGRLSQILINLMNNAIKFTHRGEVRAECELLGLKDRKMHLAFHVVDSGIGIPEERVENLFESFIQVDVSTTRKFGGTGLGLAISKRLAEMMGGEIWVKSKLGKGSIFSFTVNLDLAPGGSNVFQSPEKLQGLLVFLFEARPNPRKSMVRLLNALGCEVRAAEDREAWLGMLQADAANTKRHTLALADHHGLGEGRERVLTHAKKELSGTPLVLSVPLLQKPGMAYKAADAIVTRPVKLKSLCRALTIALGIEEPPPPVKGPTTTTRVPAGKIGKVLLVDDHPVNRRLCAQYLKNAGCTFTIAANGREALDALNSDVFDLIFMDCRMPEMDGFEATRWIRKMEGEDRHTPIIALTAGAMQDDKAACIDAGMDGYLTKPINTQKFYQALEQYLGVQLEPLILAKSWAEISQPPEEEPVELWRLREATGGQSEILIEMIQLFMTEVEKGLWELEASIGASDPETLLKVAHSLKGACANMGALSMREAATTLEKTASLGQIEDAACALDTLKSEYQVVRAYLDKAIAEEARASG